MEIVYAVSEKMYSLQSTCRGRVPRSIRPSESSFYVSFGELFTTQISVKQFYQSIGLTLNIEL